MTILRQFVFSIVFLFCASATIAAEQELDAPAKVIDDLTKQLLTMAKNGEQQLKADPNTYFESVQKLLEPAVDFRSIAKNVMGKRYWTSVSPAQQVQFVDVFTKGLVQTYGKGMSNFADFEVEVESSRGSEKSSKTHYVVQSVKTDSGVTKVVYTMRKTETSWQVRNVVLDGINLGSTFKTQFAQAVKDSGGSVPTAISQWGAKPSDTKK